MEKPLVEKNLPALVEQMQNVAGQLRSVAASAELFKMVSRTRTLISNTLYPLEKRKVRLDCKQISVNSGRHSIIFSFQLVHNLPAL